MQFGKHDANRSFVMCAKNQLKRTNNKKVIINIMGGSVFPEHGVYVFGKQQLILKTGPQNLLASLTHKH